MSEQASRPMIKPSASRDQYTEYQQRRRVDALERQKNARQSKLEKLRQLAVSSDQMEEEDEQVDTFASGSPWSGDSTSQPVADEAMGEQTEYKQPARRPRFIDGLRPKDFYSQQFMVPDWMTDVPADLLLNWYVLPRPEGKRCLVIASRGRTVARLRNGAILSAFQSQLPGGSSTSRAPGDACCILDTVFHELDSTHYVMDVLSWGALELAGCSAEMRLFWLASRLEEDGVLAAPVSEQHTHRFCTVPVRPCNPEGLIAAHSAPVPFLRDGLVLLHKEGHYRAGGTPLALLWKDAECSRYLLDTDADGIVPEFQHLVLQYRMDCTVATDDEPPVVLGKLPTSFSQAAGAKLRPGRLLRFTLRDGGIQFEEGRVVGADLHYEGPGNQRRGRADTLSKILFQYNARRVPLGLQQLLEAADTAPMQQEQEEGGANRVQAGSLATQQEPNVVGGMELV